MVGRGVGGGALPGEPQQTTQSVVTHLVLLVPGVGPVVVQQLDSTTQPHENIVLHLERKDVVMFSRAAGGRLVLLNPDTLSTAYHGAGVLTVIDDDGTSFVFPAGSWPGIRFSVAEARSAQLPEDDQG